MRLYFERAGATLYHGDAAGLDLAAESIDAIVTDPPAGISFMGKAWDGNKGGRQQWIAWLSGVMAKALGALKPGGHALVWALPRTSHWTGTALEDAGFEAIDIITHINGQGWPKSKRLLRPCSEHWHMVRRPSSGTVERNIAAHGTGGINVDACRIGRAAGDRTEHGIDGDEGHPTVNTYGNRSRVGYAPDPAGRWPSNVIFSHLEDCGEQCAPGCAVAELDRQSGVLATNAWNGNENKPKRSYSGGWNKSYTAPSRPKDSGYVSRFFYCAKPSPSERNAGCEHLPHGNNHPTLKSIAMMRYLCRLITPPGGTVLDLFAGSGSTGVAAIHEGFRFIGIERDEEYLQIAKARIGHAIEQRAKDTAQGDLFNQPRRSP